MKPCSARAAIFLSVSLLAGAAAFTASAVAANAYAADDLERGFLDPPDSAKPHTWWHWMSGNVTREGITADLEAMKRAGIAGAQIFNVSESIPDGPAPFMSPQWLDLFRHAAAEAERLGIELCLHNCAGWSSSGGPWIRPEHAMQIVVTSETRVTGPSRFDGMLPKPETRRDYYRDIAVLAFPTPRDDSFRTADIRPKAGYEIRYGMQPGSMEVPADSVIPRDRIMNLTERMGAEGRLTWDPPAGEWAVLRIGHTPTGKENHPSPDAGRGLECDKLSREALDAHWAGGIAPILEKLGPLAGKVLNNCLIDSYEVGCNNWTPRFREEFMQRRGYDPLPFLPALTGRIIDGGEITERFLWDFRRTIGDLFADNYFGYFCDLCRRNGLMASIEPYDGPFECLQAGAEADILMGEFWVGGGEPSSVKLAASAAHTHGIGIVGAESFTAAPDRGKWQNHPRAIKALGDLIWCAGVNRFIFHRYAHQPWLDKFPGMTMGQWGTHFERTNTWWEPGRAWMAYVARSQFLLQEGRFAADVLFFGGEAAPNGGVHRPDLKAKGYDYDAFGTDLVGALSAEDGCIVTPGGTRYRMLVLPDTTWMTPALARQVRDLVQAGTVVLGPKPQKSPSLSGHPRCDGEVRAIAGAVWGEGEEDHTFGEGRVIRNRTPDEVLASMGVKPDFEYAPKIARLAFIHRTAPGVDLYFVSNQRPDAVSVECLFRVSGREPELWNPETGRIEPAPLWRDEDGRTAVKMNLDGDGSIFVVFRRPASASSSAVVDLAFIAAEKPGAPPQPELEVKKALYGVLSLEGSGMVDVTDVLDKMVKDGRLGVKASNDLAGDPAYLIVKQLRVEYEYKGKTLGKCVNEGEVLNLPDASGEGNNTLRIVRAIYGKFHEGGAAPPPIKTLDITGRIAERVKGGKLAVFVDNELAGGDPAYGAMKQLRVEYTLDGVSMRAEVAEGGELRLPEEERSVPLPEPRLSVGEGTLRLLSWEDGCCTLATASGGQKTVYVKGVPESSEVTGPWEVKFPAGWGAPGRIPKNTPKDAPGVAVFEKLISWPDHEDEGVRYFSGTAAYRKTLDLPDDWLGGGRVLLLDLGRVEVMAEVRLNGRDLGVLWKEPYRVDITQAAHPGVNALEVRVTNLWPNRLIGDEQYPDDREWNGIAIRRWPDWMVRGEPRLARERLTFTTWKHWKKTDALLPSGLIGPVTLRSGVWMELE